jgi:hypothetical protein
MVLNSNFFNGSGYRPLTLAEQVAVSGYVKEVYNGQDGDSTFYVLLPSGESTYADLGRHHREDNTTVLVHGHNAVSGINYLFPTGIEDINEDFQLEKRFLDYRFYEHSGVLITYPSNHPDETPDESKSKRVHPREAVSQTDGIKDAMAAFDNLASDFSSASKEALDFTLGITNPFIHYYEDTYDQVYFPKGKTGPSNTRVNFYDTRDFDDRKPRDKSIKITGSPVAKNEQLFSTYKTRTAEDPKKEKDDNDE